MAAAVFALATTVLLAGAVSAFPIDHADLGSLPECVHSGCAQKLLLKQFADFCDDGACRASCPLITSKLCGPAPGPGPTACSGLPPQLAAGSWGGECEGLPVGSSCTAQCFRPSDESPPVANCTVSGWKIVAGECPPNHLNLTTKPAVGTVNQRVEVLITLTYADGVTPFANAAMCVDTIPFYNIDAELVTNKEGFTSALFLPNRFGVVRIRACQCRSGGGNVPTDCLAGASIAQLTMRIDP